MLHIKCTHTQEQILCQTKKNIYNMLIMSLVENLNVIKNRVLFSFLVIFFISCSEKEINEEELMSCVSLVHKRGIATYENDLYSGSCIVFGKDNLKLNLMSYKNGVLEGLQKKYYPNGKLEYKGFRKNGEIHGKFIKYFSDGGIMTEGKLKRGYYVGKWKYYDKEGNLKMEKRYNNKKIIDSIIY